jgi:hypothetical protein
MYLFPISELVKVTYKATKIHFMVYLICSFLHVEFLVANWFCIRVLDPPPQMRFSVGKFTYNFNSDWNFYFLFGHYHYFHYLSYCQ